jgi:hypothetical protein
MSKYNPLLNHLKGLDRSEEQRFSFAAIERILGFQLPASARSYQAWWANEKDGHHVQANAWLDAGRHTKDVDLKSGTVTFAPVTLPRALKDARTAGQPVRGLTILQAKQALARELGVRAEDIEITVRA